MPSVPRGPPSLRPSAPGSTLRVPRTPTRWPDRRGPQAPRWRRAPRSVTPRQPRPRRRGGGRHPGPKSRSGHSKTHHRHSLRAWARAPRTHAGTRPRGGSADGQEWQRNGIPDTVAAGPAAARAPDAAPGPAPLRRGGCLAPTGRVAQLRVPVSFRLSVCVCVCRGHLCLCPCLCDDGVRRRGRPRLGFEPGGLKDRRGQGPAGAGPGPRHTPPPPRSPQPPASGRMRGGVPSGEPSGGDEPDRPGTGARPGSRDRLGSGVRDASWPPPPGPGRRPPPPRARRGRRSVHQSGRQASMQAGRQAFRRAAQGGRRRAEERRAPGLERRRAGSWGAQRQARTSTAIPP